MVELDDHPSPLGVSALLDEIEANFSPRGSIAKQVCRESTQLHIQKTEDAVRADYENQETSKHHADFISHELSTLMCDSVAGMKDVSDLAQSQDRVVPAAHQSMSSKGVSTMASSSRSSSRGSSLWSGSHSSSSARSSPSCQSINSQSCGEAGIHRQQGKERPWEDIVQGAPDDDHFSKGSGVQEARALPLRPRAAVLGCDESINDDDFEEEFELQEARFISMQPREFVFRGNDSIVDFDEEWDFQEARALSLQPPELVRGLNESLVDFDEEYDLQEARVLSMQPREMAMGISDASVDFDDEFDIQEARALSMQPPEIALAWGGPLPK